MAPQKAICYPTPSHVPTPPPPTHPQRFSLQTSSVFLKSPIILVCFPLCSPPLLLYSYICLWSFMFPSCSLVSCRFPLFAFISPCDFHVLPSRLLLCCLPFPLFSLSLSLCPWKCFLFPVCFLPSCFLFSDFSRFPLVCFYCHSFSLNFPLVGPCGALYGLIEPYMAYRALWGFIWLYRVLYGLQGLVGPHMAL